MQRPKVKVIKIRTTLVTEKCKTLESWFRGRAYIAKPLGLLGTSHE